MRIFGRSYTHHTRRIQSASTYHYAILARKLIQAGRGGLTLIVRTTLFIGVVENIEVAVINIISDKDIGDVFQDQRLSDTSLANKRDCVWLIRPALMTPFLRDSTSLDNTVKTDLSEMSL
jgi:hypothetical protein